MKNKLTIGLFIDTFFPMIDGVTMVVHNYAKKLIKFANVIVFAPECPGKEFDDNQFPYKVVRCKALKVPIIDYGLPMPQIDHNFKKELNNYKLDIVHIHSPFMVGKLGIKYAKEHKVPVIATMHSQFQQDFKRAVKSEKIANTLTNNVIKIFEQCDECWAVNSEVARIFCEEYGYYKLPEVMNNATDLEPVSDFDKAHKRINQLHNIDENERVFLFVGRINSLKNIYLIVDSLKLIKDRNLDFKFKMLFVGSGQDEDGLNQLILKYNMENEIIMCGKVADRELLAAYYSRANLFLFPSLYDASSIVQIEAASQKTPTLFVQGSATGATITDNVNGFFAENNKESYSQKILEIMNNEKLYNYVSENAFEQIYINWDKAIEGVYSKYLEIIDSKSK